MLNQLSTSLFFVFLLTHPLKAHQLKVGETFPNLALPSVYDGKQTTTHQLLHGKKTVLHLFASW